MNAEHGQPLFQRIDAELLARGLWVHDATTRRRMAETIAGWEPSPQTLPSLLDELARSGTLISRASDIDALVQRIRRAPDAAPPATNRDPAFLGHDVSSGLRYDEPDLSKLETLGLPVLTHAGEIAAAIGIDTRQLTWLTYHRGASSVDHYARFTLPKRSGGVRVISAPKPRLREAQRWVLHRLLEPVPIHPAAKAFRSGGSVLAHASEHAGRSIVIRVDLKDFFATITLKRVKGMFRGLGYSEGVATILGLLCTDPPRVGIALDGKRHYVTVGGFQLPQGACTSPAITNILCRRMDARLTGMASAYGCRYSRYADDLVFSSTDAALRVGDLLSGVRQVIDDEGFALNDAKTQVMRAGGRQFVTGLLVNDTPRIPRADLRRFRAFLHRCERDGLDTVSGEIGKGARDYAAGYLAWIRMIDPDRATRIAERHPWILERDNATP